MKRRLQVVLLATAAAIVAACASFSRLPAPELAPAQVPVLQPLSHAPEAVPLPPLTLPPHHSETFRNGISLTYLPSTRAPYVFVQLAVDAGRLLHGSDADVVAEWLRQRGHDASTASWNQRWRAIGGVLSVQSGPHRLLFSVEVLPVHADAAQELLQTMWQQARFADADMLADVQRSLRVQQHQNDLAGGDIDRLWQQLAYGTEHPYGVSALSREALQTVTLASLTAKWPSMQRERQRWLLAGTIDEAGLHTVRQRLQQLPNSEPTARWRASPVSPPANTFVSSTTADDSTALSRLDQASPLSVHLLHQRGAAQVNVRVGFALPLPDNRTRWSCVAVAELLGRSFSGRVFADLRERRGLSYDAGGGCLTAPFASEFVLDGASRPEQAVAFLHGLLGHLALLQQQAIAADEWQAVIDELRGQTVLQLETARQRARSENGQELLGGNWHSLAERDAFWRQLSAVDASTFARDWLNGNPVIVLRGDADQLAPVLRQVWPAAVLVRHDDVP